MSSAGGRGGGGRLASRVRSRFDPSPVSRITLDADGLNDLAVTELATLGPSRSALAPPSRTRGPAPVGGSAAVGDGSSPACASRKRKTMVWNFTHIPKAIPITRLSIVCPYGMYDIA